MRAVDGILRAKVLLAAMAMAFEGVFLPVGGVIKEHHPCCAGSLGESLVHLWTSDGGTFGVVTFLEASFSETLLSLRHCWCRHGHGWLLQMVRQGYWCRWLAQRGLLSPRGGSQNFADG